MSDHACPICLEGPTHVIAELPGCWLTMGDDAAPALAGTCALFFRRHVVELHELTQEEAAQFMSAVQRVSASLEKVSGAAKINYEIHGNTIPHLHMHFFPRYPGDLFTGRPIDPRVPGTSHDMQKHLSFRQTLIERLASPG